MKMSDYFTDPDLELERLLTAGRLLTEAMGGPLSEQPEARRDSLRRVVDVACGSGEWVLKVASAYSHIEQVVGFDISEAMITYAQRQAQLQGLFNVQFEVMDVTNRLEFDDGSFDLVNARTIGFLSPKHYTGLIGECARITRPGGVIRLTESEWPFGTTPSFERFNWLFNQARYALGSTFSTSGRLNGTPAVLGILLSTAGFGNIQRVVRAIDFSSYQPRALREAWCRNLSTVYQSMIPFIARSGVAPREELEQLYAALLGEMQAPGFGVVMYLETVWAEKPL
jgi:SAM-dependent methyltransferase